MPGLNGDDIRGFCSKYDKTSKISLKKNHQKKITIISRITTHYMNDVLKFIYCNIERLYVLRYWSNMVRNYLIL